jgi:hypothetical protein
MALMPTAEDSVADHVSAAARRENVALIGTQEDVRRVVMMGPKGAMALAAAAVAMLIAIWITFFVFVFLPRGPVG